MKFEDENILVFNDFDFCYQHLKDENDKGNLLGKNLLLEVHKFTIMFLIII